MRLATLLPIVALVSTAVSLPQEVSATTNSLLERQLGPPQCDTSNTANWPSGTLASITTACDKLGGKDYTTSQERRAGVQASGGRCNRFIVKNITFATARLTKQTCIDAMRAIFNTCPHGGYEMVQSFQIE